MSNFSSMLGNAGAQAGFGIVTNAVNQAINSAFGKSMAKYNFELNEKAAENADARRRALYGDFESPMAKIRQLKEAGLSPSLYVGGELGGGIGSTAGAQGAGGTGASIPSNASISVDSLNQTKIADAQARLLNAEADKLEGKNFAGNLEAVKVFSQAGLNNAAADLKKAETIAQNIKNKYADQTAHYSLQKLIYDTEEAKNNAQKAFWEAEDKQLEWQFNAETFDIRKQEIANTVVEIATRTALEKSQRQLNDEERAHIREFAEAALENAKAHSQTATAYGDYVEAMAENLKEQIRLREKELKAEYWKMGIGAVSNVLQMGASLAGSGMFSAAAKVVGLQ